MKIWDWEIGGLEDRGLGDGGMGCNKTRGFGDEGIRGLGD